MGLAPRIDQANPSHIPVGHLVAAEVYRMVGDQFRIHTPVGLTESDGFKTSIVGRQLLLHDISLDGDPDMVGLPCQICCRMIVNPVFLKTAVSQITPQYRGHPQLMGIFKRL